MRIPVSLVEKHIDDICFLVDIDFTYVQVAIMRVRWLRPFGYELDVDEASTAITTLLAEEVDKATKPFGTFDVVKSKIETELKTTSSIKKKDKLVRKLKNKFGEGAEAEVGEEEEEEEDDEDEEEEVEEAPKQAEPKKRKEKVQPPTQPKEKKVAKPTQAKPQILASRATTRASAQKEKEKLKEKEETTK